LSMPTSKEVVRHSPNARQACCYRIQPAASCCRAEDAALLANRSCCSWAALASHMAPQHSAGASFPALSARRWASGARWHWQGQTSRTLPGSARMRPGSHCSSCASTSAHTPGPGAPCPGSMQPKCSSWRRALLASPLQRSSTYSFPLSSAR
jgi:hypothetical protein